MPATLITGGARGIGLAVAGVLAEEGFDLTLVARHADGLVEARSALEASSGRRIETVVADLSDGAEVERVIAAHLARHATLDMLVVNAGTSWAAYVGTTDPDVVRRVFSLNVDIAFELVRVALPHLRVARGWAVFVASVSGLIPTAGYAAYSASKAAVVSLARSVNLEEGANGVRACAICPAFVETRMSKSVDVPAEAMLRPGDVAEAVRMLTRLSPTATVPALALERVGVRSLEP